MGVGEKASKAPRSSKGLMPVVPTEMAKVNNAIMAAVLKACRLGCDCDVCKLLRKAAELMEAGMEAGV